MSMIGRPFVVLVVSVGCRLLGILMATSGLTLDLGLLTLLVTSVWKLLLALSMLRTLVSEFVAGSRGGRVGDAGLVVTELSSGPGEIAEDDGPGCAGIAGEEPGESSVPAWLEVV